MSIVGGLVKTAIGSAEHLVTNELAQIKQSEANIKTTLGKINVTSVSAVLASVLPIGLSASDYDVIGSSAKAIFENLTTIATKLKTVNL